VAVATVRMPAGALGRRMLIETPFVLFALALPLLGSGPSHSVAGVELSIAGLWAAWTILAKATLGVAATALVAWSSSPAEILVGLERLRVPRALVAIAGFMVRYLEVVGAELARLQIARVSRADDPRWIWQGRAVAHTAGALFVRSFERGERVHQAMLARGFDGRFPSVAAPRRRSWWPAVVWPATAALVAAVALVAELT